MRPAESSSRSPGTRRAAPSRRWRAQARGALELAQGDARAHWPRCVAPARYGSSSRRRTRRPECASSSGSPAGSWVTRTRRRSSSRRRGTPSKPGGGDGLSRVGTLAGSPRAVDAHGLTERELEVLRHLAAGETNKAIAARLVLSVQDGGPAREQHLRQARRLLAGGGDRLRTRARIGLNAPRRNYPRGSRAKVGWFSRCGGRSPRRNGRPWRLHQTNDEEEMAVATPAPTKECGGPRAADDTRERLLAGMPVAERRIELAGISTAVLEGGEGPPVVLLHEPGAFGAQWMRVIPRPREDPSSGRPRPARSRRLRGDRGRARRRASPGVARGVDRAHVQLAARPRGALAAAPIAARFALEHGERLAALVLVDSFGLGKFRPAPGFALALFRYVARPTARTYDGLMQRCTADFAGVRAGMGERWEPFEDYTLDRARCAEREGGAPRTHAGAGGADDSAGGARADRRSDDPDLGTSGPVMRLRVAEAASERYAMAAPRDRGRRRRSADRAARGVSAGAACRAR